MWRREGLGKSCSSLHLRLAPLPALHVCFATERQGEVLRIHPVQAGWAAPSGSRRRYVAPNCVISAAWEVRLTPSPHRAGVRSPLGCGVCEHPKKAAPGLVALPSMERGPPQPAPKPLRPAPPAVLCYRAFPASATTPRARPPVLAFGETALCCPCIEENFFLRLHFCEMGRDSICPSTRRCLFWSQIAKT